VVGCEKHDERFAAGVLGELMHLAVSTDEREIRGSIATLKRMDVRRVAVDEAGGVGSADAECGDQNGKERQESLHGDKG
jgi:hypothetical protein